MLEVGLGSYQIHLTQNIALSTGVPPYISGHMLLINNNRIGSTPKTAVAGVEMVKKTRENLSHLSPYSSTNYSLMKILCASFLFASVLATCTGMSFLSLCTFVWV